MREEGGRGKKGGGAERGGNDRNSRPADRLPEIREEKKTEHHLKTFS